MPNTRLITAADALREATELSMQRDERIYLMGEGVADPKGIFGTTLGLLERFGPQRVIEMPVAENGLTGIAIGSAVRGMRPLMVHQRVDFALLALEQIFNNAAKFHYVSAAAHKVPLVIRLVIGRGWGQGPAHSQSLETLFSCIPGLKVVMPSTASDCKGMLIAALEDDNPVAFLEHRWVHYATGEVPEGYYTVPLDGPRIARQGKDATIVATAYMVYEALLAAEALAKLGISTEVIDLRVIRPLNTAPILDSVRKTRHLITIDTGHRLHGIGGEIVAQVIEQDHGALAAAPIRLGLPDHPTPSSRTLAANYYPTALTIAQAVAYNLGLDEEKIAPALEEIRAVMLKSPSDVPNQAFRGPF
jgi:pyruvate dehydrogenase E1 component beta subunit